MARVSDAAMAQFNEMVKGVIVDLYSKGEIKENVTAKKIKEITSKYNFEHYPNILYKNRATYGVYNMAHLLGKKEKAEKPSTPKQKTVSVKKDTTMDMAVVPMKKQKDSTKIENDFSYYPEKNPNFVKFGNYKDLKAIVESREFFPVYVYGPTGNGKSTMVEEIHAELKLPMIRVNLDMETDEDKLIGRQSLEDGNIVIVEGPVLIAMRQGITILLDEIDAGRANALMCLQGILEGKPFYFKLKNEIIKPAKGFNIIVTANTKGQGAEDNRYVGTNVLNEAFLDRFTVTFNQEYPPEKVEKDIVTKLMQSKGCYNEQVLNSLVKWCSAIRITYVDGGCNELISTRRMVHIVNTYALFKDINKAVKLAVNRFDPETGSAFLNLFEKIAGEPEPATQSVEPATPYTLVDF